MRIAFIVVLLTLVCFGNTAQDSPSKDGRIWGHFGTASKEDGVLIKGAYVQGVIDGLRVGATVGYFDGRLDESDRVLNYEKQCVAEKGSACAVLPAAMYKEETFYKEALAGVDKEKEKLTPMHHTSVLDVVRQTDKFYSDYRNTPVCMIAAVQESIRSLNGTPSTEQALELMRKQGCS
jgi:hypothetical protein